MSGKLALLVALALGGALSVVAIAAGGDTVLGRTDAPARHAGSLPQGSEPVTLNPADFVRRIDNPYWPMAPGTRWVYRETDPDGNRKRVEITVTKRNKTIVGIRATVVHDVVSQDGEVIEDTYDWYAQDRWGNVWYLGEDTTEYENGKPVSKAGSWEAGVDGAQPGVIVPARPVDGLTYREEYYAGQAEDAAEVLSLEEQAEVPYSHFDRVLLTKDFTALEPDVLEYKLYAKGVGPVLALDVSGGNGREELVRFKEGSRGIRASHRQFISPAYGGTTTDDDGGS